MLIWTGSDAPILDTLPEDPVQQSAALLNGERRFFFDRRQRALPVSHDRRKEQRRMQDRTLTLHFKAVDGMTDEDFHKSIASWLWGSGLIGTYLDLCTWPILSADEVQELRAKYDPAFFQDQRRQLEERESE